jgi:hypothetical protein
VLGREIAKTLHVSIGDEITLVSPARRSGVVQDGTCLGNPKRSVAGTRRRPRSPPSRKLLIAINALMRDQRPLQPAVIAEPSCC